MDSEDGRGTGCNGYLMRRNTAKSLRGLVRTSDQEKTGERLERNARGL
ncbi:MAG TPA: hypothetical protein VEI96_00675 [Thermodesulfovibrionales bacterium]|nr:hypothetical protein [Thermodesulfovibrionales bacterium]